MAYAIALYLDHQTSGLVRGMWRNLADSGIAPHMWHSGDRPHITLAIFDEMDIPAAQVALVRFAQSMTVEPVSMPGLGVFPAPSSVVYLDVTATARLLAMHELVHEYFTGLGQSSWDLYTPGLWSPHCTLAMNLPLEAVPRAIAVCLADWRPMHGLVEQMGIVQFEPIQHVYSLPLTPRAMQRR